MTIKNKLKQAWKGAKFGLAGLVLTGAGCASNQIVVPENGVRQAHEKRIVVEEAEVKGDYNPKVEVKETPKYEDNQQKSETSKEPKKDSNNKYSLDLYALQRNQTKSEQNEPHPTWTRGGGVKLNLGNFYIRGETDEKNVESNPPEAHTTLSSKA